MKRISVLLSGLLLIVFIAGCGNTSKTNPANASEKQAQQQGNSWGRNQDAQTPEAKLRRELMSLSRLGRGDNSITKEQQGKLTPILEDIKAKQTIDDTYAAKKIAEIENILTAQQKESLSAPRGNGFNERGNRNGDGNGNNQPPSMSRDPGQDGNNQRPERGNQRPGGQRPQMGSQGPQGGGGGFDLKSLCDGILESWKTTK